MPRYRLLALDIDGTLVNSQSELTEPTRTALLTAQAAGLKVVLATGRRYSRVLPLVAPLQLDLPLITASGALIKHPRDHRTLFRAQFEPRTLRGLLGVIAAAGYDAVLYGDTFDQGFDYYCASQRSHQPEHAEFMLINAGSERVLPGLMTRPPGDVFAGFAIGPFEEMISLQTKLERQLPNELYVHVLRSPRYTGHMCEIAPHGVSKWSGVCQLANAWGISAAEICAVGDDVNDIPMIRAAGLGVAMANALDSVKAVADRIAPGNDQDGIVEVVSWLT